MMDLIATWHKESWDAFLKEGLPRLLSDACELSAYSTTLAGGSRALSCDVSIGLAGRGQDIEVRYSGIPVPDDEGIFTIEGQPVVVVPEAEDDRLLQVACCGELAMTFLKTRIGKAGEGYLQDAEAAQSWLPLHEWLGEFFREKGQLLDGCNRLSRLTHLRRLRIKTAISLTSVVQTGLARPLEHPVETDFDKVLTFERGVPAGLICPLEQPEGPNLGKVVTVARGAVIRSSRLVKVSQSPADFLGPGASMIPFIEYSDPARLLMGANMMRQWVPPLNPEPAIVRTGNEPEDPEFWCGFNLLTAFTSMGRLTYEDAIVLSRSAVERMRYDVPVEVGDKLSNRHGTKGVVSSVLPDEQMPRLPDGTPVECVFSFIALHTRMNTGQLLEAVYSRLVEMVRIGEAPGDAGKALEGFKSIVAPFEAPSREQISQWLSACGLPDRGMEYLGIPGSAEPPFPTVVGRVYWGRTHHMPRTKLKIFMEPDALCQVQGAMEYMALRNCGAYHVISEMNSITSVDVPEAKDLVDRLERGEDPVPSEETGAFRVLAERLRRGGIGIRRSDGGVGFSLLQGQGMALAMPVPHPWRSSVTLSHLPECPEDDGYQKIVSSNDRLQKLMKSGAPESLIESSRDALFEQIRHYFSALIGRKEVSTRGRRIFSGRSVIVPGKHLSVNQVGLPEEVVWSLFGPLVAREVGKDAARRRTGKAEQALSRILAARMIFLNRAPTIKETAMLAFHPVRVPHSAIEFHPLVCRWMNADFDGDQMAFFLPITDEAQADLRERLSVRGHLERDPSLLDGLLPTHEALWGLAWLSLSDAGRESLREVLGFLPGMPDGILSAASFGDAMRTVLEKQGAADTIAAAEKLLDLGLGAAADSGASLNPFMEIPGMSSEGGISRAEAEEIAASFQDYGSLDIGPQLLAVKAGARGSLESLLRLAFSCNDEVPTPSGEKRRITLPRISGLSPEDFFPLCSTIRKWLAEAFQDVLDISAQRDRMYLPSGYTVLARAVKSGDPGIVFASAAARGEVDPLQDIDSRLFMGLAVE